MSDAPLISVVFNTLNEARHLPYALRSVRSWADEIVVVDMHSDDQTQAIARESGARVVTHERIGFVEPARRFAVEQARGRFVLLLDADEVVMKSLVPVLQRIAAEDEADFIYLPYVNYMLGEHIRYSGWGPIQDNHPRLFKAQFVELPQAVHGRIMPGAGARVLTLPYVKGAAIAHFGYLGVSHYLRKLNAYTDVEAAQAIARGERGSRARAIYQTAREFARRYIHRRGYKDGWRGFYISVIGAFYKFIAEAKITERAALDGCADVDAVLDAKYQQIAETLCQAHEEERS